MKNLKISMKLLMPHIFILALLVLGVIVDIISITNIREQTEALYDGLFAIKSTAGTVNKTLETMQMSVYRAISNNSRHITDEAIIEARNSAIILQEQITQLKQNTLGDTGALLRLETNLSELAPMQEQVLVLASQNKNAEASAYMEDRNVSVINEAQRQLRQYILSAEAKERELVASLQQAQRKTISLRLILVAAGILFAVKDGAFFWQVYKGFRRSCEN